MYKFLYELLAPPDSTTDSVADDKELSIGDMIESMGDDDKPDDDKKDDDLLTKEDESVDEDEKEEKDEIELDEEDEPEIKEDELDDIQDVPRKEILKAYPDLFKKFPQLEKAYYREQKYAELLPTIDDAKEAVEKASSFDKFSQTLMNGDLNQILATVKQTDEKAYGKLVDNYLEDLGKIDKEAYYHVIGNTIKRVIVHMVNEGNSRNIEELTTAASILNQFMFQSAKFTEPAKFSKTSEPANEESAKLNNERAQFMREKFDSALEDLSSKTSNIIKSTISKHIDPKDSMSEYVKKTAIKDALASVDKLIDQDGRFKSVLNKLWEKAAEKNFNSDSLENIRKAYLNKAKTLLPQVIQRHRNEALKGLGIKKSAEKEEVSKKGLIAPGRDASANNRSSKAKEIPKGMSTLDYLNQD